MKKFTFKFSEFGNSKVFIVGIKESGHRFMVLRNADSSGHNQMIGGVSKNEQALGEFAELLEDVVDGFVSKDEAADSIRATLEDYGVHVSSYSSFEIVK